MFNSLSDKLDSIFKKIRGRGALTAKDIEATLKEVRMALLEADVNFKVAKDLCKRIAEKSEGAEILSSLSPGQQVIKIVHEQLIETLGSEHEPLDLKVTPPAIIMLVGLQGSGKTTSSAKLALYLKSKLKRSPYLVPADIYRPAAIAQLKTLAKQINVPVFDSNPQDRAVDIVTKAVQQARLEQADTVIIDTAGRLQIDEELMSELSDICSAVNPKEILLVADAMTGQEAVNVAEGFNAQIGITGLILTKLDGDARGGAALSMRAVTGKPIKFAGIGERPNEFEPFHPSRLASRILGMGDVLTLIEKATQEVTLEDSMELHKKIKKDKFSFDDFLTQLRMIRRMGSLGSIAGMIPGIGKLAKSIDEEQAENELRKIEAIILSMTTQERNNHAMINGSRRKRIASGSGTKVQDVNQLLKQFTQMKTMMKSISKMGMGGMMNMLGGKGGLKNMANLFKG